MHLSLCMIRPVSLLRTFSPLNHLQCQSRRHRNHRRWLSTVCSIYVQTWYRLASQLHPSPFSLFERSVHWTIFDANLEDTGTIDGGCQRYVASTFWEMVGLLHNSLSFTVSAGGEPRLVSESPHSLAYILICAVWYKVGRTRPPSCAEDSCRAWAGMNTLGGGKKYTREGIYPISSWFTLPQTSYTCPCPTKYHSLPTVWNIDRQLNGCRISGWPRRMASFILRGDGTTKGTCIFATR